MTISSQQYRERYQMLPPELQEALLSEEASNLFWHLVEILNVTDAKAGPLASLVNETIAGFSPLKQFIPELEKRLGVASQEAERIGNIFLKEVFAPINAYLANFSGESPARRMTPVLVPQMPVEIPTQSKPQVFGATPQPPKAPETKPFVAPSPLRPAGEPKLPDLRPELPQQPVASAPSPIPPATLKPKITFPGTPSSSGPTVLRPVAPEKKEAAPIKEVRFVALPKSEEVPKTFAPGFAHTRTAPVPPVSATPLTQPSPAPKPHIQPTQPLAREPETPAPRPPAPSAPPALQKPSMPSVPPTSSAPPATITPQAKPAPKAPPGAEIIDLSTLEIRKSEEGPAPKP